MNRRHRDILLGCLRGSVAEVAKIQAKRIRHTIRERREVRGNACCRRVQCAGEVESRLAGHLRIEVFVQRVQRADDRLLGEHAGHDAHGRGPVVVVHAQRGERRGHRAAGAVEHRALAVGAEAAARADRPQHGEHDDHRHDDLARPQREALQAVPGVRQQPARRGHVIRGSSITNGVGWPRSSVERSTRPVNTAAAIPIR